MSPWVRAVLVLCLGASGAPAWAQGVVDPITGTVAPVPQAAAVDDATARFVNPAGLAHVEAFQWVSGYAGRYGDRPSDSFFTQAALSPWDGFVLSTGAGALLRPEGALAPYGHWNTALAFRLERAFALGASWTWVYADAPGAEALSRTDLGAQWRPSSWLSFGSVLEGLGSRGDTTRAFDMPSFRLGMSLRPVGDWLTVGLDARAIAGNPNLLVRSAYTDARWQPALHAQVRLGGVAVQAGAQWYPATSQTPADVSVGVGIQLDTEHLGLSASGAARGLGDAAADVMARISAERFPSLAPPGRDWISLSLVNEGVPERDPDDVAGELFSPPPDPTAVIAALERACGDPDIEGVLLRLRGLSLGWGRLQELRDALARLRSAGKRSVVHLDFGGDAELFVASAAERIYLSPAGNLDVNGLQLVMTYYGDALQRFGIEAEAVVAGTHKNAPRAFVANAPSEEELDVENALLDEIFSRLVKGLAEGRQLSESQVEAIIDRGGLGAREALEAGVIDGLAHVDEMRERIRELVGHRPYLNRRYLSRSTHARGWSSPKRIAVVPILGTIRQGRAEGGLFGATADETGADDVIDALEYAGRDDDVVAVVLRIDSPGGDALASDQIWRAVMRLRDAKPVVASMGDVAASGGYYVAAGAQEIFAQPTTITGSIGVYSLSFHAEELLDDIGIAAYELRRGQRPGPTLFRGPTPEERARAQLLVDQTYERFLDVVRQSRTIDEVSLRASAEGRVWSGHEARERKLVDHMGGLPDALSRARALAGLSPQIPVELAVLSRGEETLPRIQTALWSWLGVSGERARLRAAWRLLAVGADEVVLLDQAGRPMALPRARLRIH